MPLSKEKKKGCFYTVLGPCLIAGEKLCTICNCMIKKLPLFEIVHLPLSVIFFTLNFQKIRGTLRKVDIICLEAGRPLRQNKNGL